MWKRITFTPSVAILQEADGMGGNHQIQEGEEEEEKERGRRL